MTLKSRILKNNLFAEWSSAALDLFAPPQCVGCNKIGAAWCLECREKNIGLSGELCRRCGKPGSESGCTHCDSYASVFEAARSFAVYRPPFRNLVIRLKYAKDHALGEIAAGLCLPAVQFPGWEVDLIVPVPLGKERLSKRGYNQVDLFGQPLARRMDLAYRADLLRRVRETRSQVGLTGEQRHTNLTSAFQASAPEVSGKHVLLLDDVFTTGSTGNACASALYEAGAASVFVFTLARAVPEDELIQHGTVLVKEAQVP